VTYFTCIHTVELICHISIQQSCLKSAA